MAKTTHNTKRTTTTSRANTDSTLFQMIEQCAALWRESNRLDEMGDREREDGVIHEACELERQIAATRVFTRQGYEAKCRLMTDANFDSDELCAYAVLLGRDAQRIGITEVAPACITKRKGWQKYHAAQALRIYRAKPRAAAAGAAQAEAATA